MARPRKPDHLKVLEGNPGRRPINRNSPATIGGPVCPDHITGYAAEVWQRVTGAMPPGLYAACDSDLLATYCLAAATIRTAALKRQEAADIAETNKWATVIGKAASVLVTAGAKLGLDPVSRSSLTMPPTEKPSKFDELLYGWKG